MIIGVFWFNVWLFIWYWGFEMNDVVFEFLDCFYFCEVVIEVYCGYLKVMEYVLWIFVFIYLELEWLNLVWF